MFKSTTFKANSNLVSDPEVKARLVAVRAKHQRAMNVVVEAAKAYVEETKAKIASIKSVELRRSALR